MGAGPHDAPARSFTMDQTPLEVEGRAVAPGGLSDKLRRLAGRHSVQLVAAQVDEIVVAIGMPERAFGKNESGCEALGFGGLQNIGQVVRGGADLFLLFRWFIRHYSACWSLSQKGGE